MLMHRLGRLLVRAASLLAALALLAGLPTVLVLFVGWPLPHRVPADWASWEHILTGGFPDQAVINLLAVALWLVWAAFCYSLIGEIAGTGWGRPARQVRMISPMQTLAALLVTGMSAGPAATSAALVVPPAVVATVAPPATTAPASAQPDGNSPHAPTALPWLTVTTGHQATAPATATDLHGTTGVRTSTAAGTSALPRFALAAQSGPLTVAAGDQRYTVTVQRGDTLWDLAGAWLGDPHRWPEIYHLNADRYDDHGRMRGGHHIEPTWVLTLPEDATPPPGSQIADPPQQDPGPQQPPGTHTNASPVPATTPSGSATPAPTTAAPSPGTPTAAPGSDPAPTSKPDGRAHRPHGITLASGSWLDLGLATAIGAAVALVWTHRRRRYTRRAPSPELRLTDPDVAPMPPVVNQIRRRLRHAGQRPLDFDDTRGPQRLDIVAGQGDTPDEGTSAPTADDNRVLDAGLDLLDQEPGGLNDRADEPDDDGVEEPDTPASAPNLDHAGDADSGQPRPAVPSLAHPLAAVWPPAGLGLTGPGAEAAARGFLAAALAAGGLAAPDERSWVVMPSATAATLLGADAVVLPETPRLTVTGGLDEALDLLEAQTLHRSRLVYAHEVETVAQLRAADPAEEPLPPILLLADATTRHQRTRIAALLAQGQRLDIHGVLLGAWPDGNTVVVAADGTTSRADGDGSRHGDHPADIGRLAILTPAETSGLLVTLAESHTGAPQAPAPVASAATTPGAAPAGPAAQAGGGDCGDCTNQPATGPASTPAAALAEPGSADGAELAAQEPPVAAVTGTDTDDTADDSSRDEGGPGRVEVTVLGPAGILDVPPGPNLRKKSLEALVYLAVHDGEASAEAILDDLMPDVPASKAPGRLYTYISDLRTVLRRTGGRGTYVTHPNQRYALNHDTVEVDLWRMRAAIRDAQRATAPAERITYLRRAVDTYGGHLAEGADYEWIEPYREAVRQQALDAHLALTGVLEDNPAEQVAVLDAAIRHNPYVEELYQQAMRAQAALGHLDAIRTLRRTLTRALGEIDAEPTDETSALADQLVAGLQRPGRQPGPRSAPRPGTATSDGAAA